MSNLSISTRSNAALNLNNVNGGSLKSVSPKLGSKNTRTIPFLYSDTNGNNNRSSSIGNISSVEPMINESTNDHQDEENGQNKQLKIDNSNNNNDNSNNNDNNKELKEEDQSNFIEIDEAQLMLNQLKDSLIARAEAARVLSDQKSRLSVSNACKDLLNYMNDTIDPFCEGTPISNPYKKTMNAKGGTNKLVEEIASKRYSEMVAFGLGESRLDSVLNSIKVYSGINDYDRQTYNNKITDMAIQILRLIVSQILVEFDDQNKLPPERCNNQLLRKFTLSASGNNINNNNNNNNSNNNNNNNNSNNNNGLTNNTTSSNTNTNSNNSNRNNINSNDNISITLNNNSSNLLTLNSSNNNNEVPNISIKRLSDHFNGRKLDIFQRLVRLKNDPYQQRPLTASQLSELKLVWNDQFVQDHYKSMRPNLNKTFQWAIDKYSIMERIFGNEYKLLDDNEIKQMIEYPINQIPEYYIVNDIRITDVSVYDVRKMDKHWMKIFSDVKVFVWCCSLATFDEIAVNPIFIQKPVPPTPPPPPTMPLQSSQISNHSNSSSNNINGTSLSPLKASNSSSSSLNSKSNKRSSHHSHHHPSSPPPPLYQQQYFDHSMSSMSSVSFTYYNNEQPTPVVNSLNQSIQIFRTLSRHTNTPAIIFFTEKERFVEKLKAGAKFSTHFPDYAGNNKDFNAILDFIKKQFNPPNDNYNATFHTSSFDGKEDAKVISTVLLNIATQDIVDMI